MTKKITDVRTWFEGRYEVVQSGCWEWSGAISSNGYGNTKIPGVRRYITAHKLSYLLNIGEYDQSLDLDHLCRNRRCVNPAHLEPVTRSVNLNRGAKRKGNPFCGKGHPMSGENLYTYPTGRRGCRACIKSYRVKLMTGRRGFMDDLSSETQAKRARMNPERHDSAKQRERSLKSPWRKGPTVKSRNAHDAFTKTVAADAHGLRASRK